MFVMVGNRGGFKHIFVTVFGTLQFQERILSNGDWRICTWFVL